MYYVYCINIIYLLYVPIVVTDTKYGVLMEWKSDKCIKFCCVLCFQVVSKNFFNIYGTL